MMSVECYLVTGLGASVDVIVVVNSLVMLVVMTEIEAGRVVVSTLVTVRGACVLVIVVVNSLVMLVVITEVEAGIVAVSVSVTAGKQSVWWISVQRTLQGEGTMQSKAPSSEVGSLRCHISHHIKSDTSILRTICLLDHSGQLSHVRDGMYIARVKAKIAYLVPSPRL